MTPGDKQTVKVNPLRDGAVLITRKAGMLFEQVTIPNEEMERVAAAIAVANWRAREIRELQWQLEQAEDLTQKLRAELAAAEGEAA
jgi:hypothetical protein